MMTLDILINDIFRRQIIPVLDIRPTWLHTLRGVCHPTSVNAAFFFKGTGWNRVFVVVRGVIAFPKFAKNTLANPMYLDFAPQFETPTSSWAVKQKEYFLL